jgi:hypothetical protein
MHILVAFIGNCDHSTVNAVESCTACWYIYRVKHATAEWPRHYATNRQVLGSTTDVVIHFLSICVILPAALGPGVYPASDIDISTRNRNKNFSAERSAAGAWG